MEIKGEELETVPEVVPTKKKKHDKKVFRSLDITRKKRTSNVDGFITGCK